MLDDRWSSAEQLQASSRRFNPVFLCVSTGGEVVKIAQLASLAGPQSRVAQPETPVTLQFQGNKFTLSHSQLRQLTAGQPLQLQGKGLPLLPHCRPHPSPAAGLGHVGWPQERGCFIWRRPWGVLRTLDCWPVMDACRVADTVSQ